MIATVEETSVEPKKWVMPHVTQGQRLLFFRYGQRAGKAPFVAFCIKISGSTITLKTVDGVIWSAVRHIDDPRLKESEEQRRDLGAWDYTDDEKEDRQFKEEVRSKLCDLSKQVAGLIAASAKKGGKE